MVSIVPLVPGEVAVPEEAVVPEELAVTGEVEPEEVVVPVACAKPKPYVATASAKATKIPRSKRYIGFISSPPPLLILNSFPTLAPIMPHKGLTWESLSLCFPKAFRWLLLYMPPDSCHNRRPATGK
jgi:hypothetical protein